MTDGESGLACYCYRDINGTRLHYWPDALISKLGEPELRGEKFCIGHGPIRDVSKEEAVRLLKTGRIEP